MNPVCTMNPVCAQSSGDFSDALQQQLTVEPLRQPLGRSRAARCLRGSADGTGLIHDTERPNSGAERMRQAVTPLPATALRLVD